MHSLRPMSCLGFHFCVNYEILSYSSPAVKFWCICSTALVNIKTMFFHRRHVVFGTLYFLIVLYKPLMAAFEILHEAYGSQKLNVIQHNFNSSSGCAWFPNPDALLKRTNSELNIN